MSYHIKKARNIINLTGETIHMYDDTSGSIVDFRPAKRKVLGLPRKKSVAEFVNSRTYYAVTPELLDEIELTERRVDDIAVITSCGIGRNGIKIACLAWAKNPNYPVRFARN